MPLSIRECTVSELINDPNMSALMAEYAESAIDGLGLPETKLDVYQQLEDAGLLHCLGAFVDDGLVGFLAFVLTESAHYGKVVAQTDTFFVASPARKNGAGTQLLRKAERLATSLGAVCLMVSAPTGSNLDWLLPRSGYRHSHTVFLKVLHES